MPDFLRARWNQRVAAGAAERRPVFVYRPGQAVSHLVHGPRFLRHLNAANLFSRMAIIGCCSSLLASCLLNSSRHRAVSMISPLPVQHCRGGRNILDHWSCLIKCNSTCRSHIFRHRSRHSIGDSRRGRHGSSHLDSFFQNLRHWHSDNSLLHSFTRGYFNNIDCPFKI